MVFGYRNLLLVGILLAIFILFSGSLVFAGFTDCYAYVLNADQNGCDASSSCQVTTPATDLWCQESGGWCCVEISCWQYDGNQTGCEDETDSLNCTWDPYMNIYYPNGSLASTGGCMMDWGSGTGDWGGVQDGCWQWNGDKGVCTSASNAQKCNWVANEADQNPWCGVKNLYDAQVKNSDATSIDIGCCEQKGCWNYDGNQTQCESSFGGLCVYDSNNNFCYTKWCNEVYDETNCTRLQTDLMMPCTWSEESCVDQGGGGFTFYNDSDSCMDNGGWYNSTGGCEMPSGDFGGGGGGFMFGGEAHCWFADNQPDVCKNITGCVYCNASDTHFNVSGTSGTLNESSACYQRQIGFCQGHQLGVGELAIGDIETDNLNCTHIKIKSACKYGPLPNCKWTNSSAATGEFCEPGKSSEQKSQPPVPFCEHPDAQNNYTLCMQLKNTYMMPCKWGNASSNKTLSDNCTFNPNAVFGTEEKEFELVNSELACVASGGTWKTEYYINKNILKQDSWCEKGALFDYGSGQAAANKGNCDLNCWACEFNTTGGNYNTNVTAAEAACYNSALGYCKWTNDTNSPNDLGWCDYPEEMSYGAGDCQSNCKDCGLMGTPYSSCVNSAAECKWVNDTASSTDSTKLSTGVCVTQNKKTCDDDCFSCSNFAECNSSSVNCQWDVSKTLCKPAAFDGEICFEGSDNDGDSLVDCSDPDCSFDTSCGGNSFGDCAQHSYDSFRHASWADAVFNCTNATAFGNQYCKWINFSWEEVGHCGMPGEDCWTYDWNMTLCGLTDGCTNTSNSGGFGDFCDINMTKTQNANCWQYTDNESITGCYDGSSGECKWVTPDWGQPHCDYWAFAQCDGHADSTTCGEDGNCTWKQDEWMDHGWCDVACFNMTMSSAEVCTAVAGGVCEWKSASSNICVPETFDVMSGGTGAKIGCPQYDGNYTGCMQNNYTCVYINDSNVDNNVSGGGDVDGWCNNKGNYEMTGDMKGDMIFLGMDSGNEISQSGMSPEADVYEWADIKGFGMRITDTSYGFGVGILNLTNGAVCNGYSLNFNEAVGEPTVGSGLNITKVEWYIDTDKCYDPLQGDAVRPCGENAPSCAANLQPLDDGIGEVEYATGEGFEFYIKYIVQNNTNTGKIETSKKLYRCVLNSTSGWQWVPTNVFIADDKKFTCYDSGDGAVFVSVEKESLENFPEFNLTSPLTIFVVSYKGYGGGDGADGVGPGYYTPGSVDFGFVDCSDPDTKDPKCKFFNKFGFQAFEDCKNNIDDDTDGLVDCDDSDCAFTPNCASGTAFDFTSGIDDNKAPIVIFSSVDKMSDAAIVFFDTDEPANGTLQFYKNSTTCTVLNATVNDLGSNLFVYDDYKPYHRVSLDLNTLGYALSNATTYYYRVKICDSFTNCGTSACLNFTTKKLDKEFIFRMDVPEGYNVSIPALNYSGNFTASFGDETFDIGLKTNSSTMRNTNITIYCGDLRISFFGVDLNKPKTINLNTAFICDQVNEILGMNSSSKSWHTLLQDLGLGGANDYIELEFPVAYSASNTINWCNDDSTECSAVSNYVTCTGTTTTICKIPTSLGFSTYTVSVPSSGDDSGSGGGGGGGGLVIPITTNGTTTTTTPITGGVVDEEDGSQMSPEDEDSFELNNSNLLLIGVILVAVIVIVLIVVMIVKKKEFN